MADDNVEVFLKALVEDKAIERYAIRHPDYSGYFVVDIYPNGTMKGNIRQMTFWIPQPSEAVSFMKDSLSRQGYLSGSGSQ